MSGTLFAFVAFILIAVSLLIWMNVFLLRSRRQVAGKDSSDEALPREHGSDVNQPPAEDSAQENAASVLPAHKDHGHQHVEVLSHGRSETAPNKVFTRNVLPYVLRTTSVPLFDHSSWQSKFAFLEQDQRVVGWIAFHEDIVGAADHDYDDSFIEMLRNYRRAGDRLRREVGLSRVDETLLKGEEGRVWFIADKEDTWFALFLDPNEEVSDIADRLLATAES
jgi:hypothetical protein